VRGWSSLSSDNSEGNALPPLWDVELYEMFLGLVTRGRGNPTGANQHSEPESGNGDNIPVSSPPPRGTSLSYAVRRLSRERPDLLDRVKGE
jgi:hypothetical protein